MARHMLGLFQGLPGARRWRQLLSQLGPLAETADDLLLPALTAVTEATRLYHQRQESEENND